MPQHARSLLALGAVLARSRYRRRDGDGDGCGRRGCAIFISAFATYQYDGSYAVDVQQAHPGRFALVKPVNSDDAAVADVIADWKKTPGTVSIRIMMTKENKTN
jgi:hypothetical protein